MYITICIILQPLPMSTFTCERTFPGVILILYTAYNKKFKIVSRATIRHDVILLALWIPL